MNQSTDNRTLLRALGMRAPIVQAPMAGVSTPALAAAVSNAGGPARSAWARQTPTAPAR